MAPFSCNFDSDSFFDIDFSLLEAPSELHYFGFSMLGRGLDSRVLDTAPALPLYTAPLAAKDIAAQWGAEVVAKMEEEQD